jgi:guanylate kinase
VSREPRCPHCGGGFGPDGIFRHVALADTQQALAQHTENYATVLRELADAQREIERLREFAQFVVTLDDPRAVELRRSITLNEIIARARAALEGMEVG